MGQLLKVMRKDMSLLDKSNQVKNFAEQGEKIYFSPTLLANVDNCIIVFVLLQLIEIATYYAKLSISPFHIY